MKLSEYKIGKTIGEGAFSKVKIAKHAPSGEKVAIKIIDKKLLEEKAQRSRVAHEEREKRRLIKERQKAYKEEMKRRQNENKDAELEPTGPADEEVDLAALLMQVKEDTVKKNIGILEEVEKIRKDSATFYSDPKLGYLSTFQKEVLLMMRFDHPNVIKTYKIIESEEECYIIMCVNFKARAYAKGGELMDYIISNGYLQEKEARNFFRQIVSAMDYIHESRVVHRDLKLENILLDEDRNVLISDFGLGRTFEIGDDNMKTFCGTPNYAAVELVSGTPYDGVKTDIWAMGVVLYIMNAGVPPFTGDSISTLYRRIKDTSFFIPPHFTADLVDLLKSIFVKDPKQRITMEEIRSHPWLNFDYSGPPKRYEPKIMNEAALGSVISSVTFDKQFTIYNINSHQKDLYQAAIANLEQQQNRLNASPNSVQLRRRKSISVCQPNTLSPSASQESSFGAEKSFVLPLSDYKYSTPSRRRSSIQADVQPYKANSIYSNSTTTHSSSIAGSSMSMVVRRPSIAISVDIEGHIKENFVFPEVKQAYQYSLLHPEPLKEETRELSGIDENELTTPIDPATPFEIPVPAMTASGSTTPIGAVTRAPSRQTNLAFEPKRRGRSFSMSYDNSKNRKEKLDDEFISRARKEKPVIEKEIPTVEEFPSTENGESRKEMVMRRMSLVGPQLIPPAPHDRKLSVASSIGQASFVDQSLNFVEIEDWHLTHKPPKTIRTMRFIIKSGFSSSLDPATMFQDLHKALHQIGQKHKENMTFKRLPEYYLFHITINFLEKYDEALRIEIELCKVWLLNLHALRIRRLNGDGFAFKEFYNDLKSKLGWQSS
ncbi:MAP/microtubule affinity-regulating kinase 3 [Terramyces sp. JEL0728]|nr:MAP/microtubule affinity-regulating kinase 3 [Terramyces sp. JEL0728]